MHGSFVIMSFSGLCCSRTRCTISLLCRRLIFVSVCLLETHAAAFECRWERFSKKQLFYQSPTQSSKVGEGHNQGNQANRHANPTGAKPNPKIKQKKHDKHMIKGRNKAHWGQATCGQRQKETQGRQVNHEGRGRQIILFRPQNNGRASVSWNTFPNRWDEIFIMQYSKWEF